MALFTVGAGPVPPFLLTGLCFSVAAALGFADMRRRGVAIGPTLRQSPKVWLLGVGGLFGYHFFYFTALQNAPPAEAGLIAYLWPLLIVLLSGFLPGVTLGPWHAIGASLGFLGAAIPVVGGTGFAVSPAALPGYLAALLCAAIWSGYSVLNRHAGAQSTESVAGFCAGVAVLALACHAVFEETILPDGWLAWLSILGLALGPVGGAFYAWDIGSKRGDIQLLGAGSYAAPLVSTLILVGFGIADPSVDLALSAVLISGGAGLAAVGSARYHRYVAAYAASG